MASRPKRARREREVAHEVTDKTSDEKNMEKLLNAQIRLVRKLKDEFVNQRALVEDAEDHLKELQEKFSMKRGAEKKDIEKKGIEMKGIEKKKGVSASTIPIVSRRHLADLIGKSRETKTAGPCLKCNKQNCDSKCDKFQSSSAFPGPKECTFVCNNCVKEVTINDWCAGMTTPTICPTCIALVTYRYTAVELYRASGRIAFGEFCIYGKYLTGKLIILDVKSNDSVETLKKKVEEQGGLPPFEMRLIFAGVQLMDGVSLSHYKIQKDSTVHILRV